VKTAFIERHGLGERNEICDRLEMFVADNELVVLNKYYNLHQKDSTHGYCHQIN